VIRAALLGVILAIPMWSQTRVAISCVEDSKINEVAKNAIDSSATSFLNLLLGSTPATAFDSLSEQAKQNGTREQYIGLAKMVSLFDPKHVSIQHTYLIGHIGKGIDRVPCEGAPPNQNDSESLSVVSVAQQAHVLLAGDMPNNKLAIDVWLVREQGVWKVQGVWAGPSSLGGKDARTVRELAPAQQNQGHSLNAALLYAGAAQVANRGPYFQTGTMRLISDEMSQLNLPAEIKGQAPFAWKNGDTRWEILNVGPIAIGDKLYVVIVHQVQPWESNTQVDGWNKELIAYFKKRFPEYSDVFSGVVARAMEQGTSRGFGTVEEIKPEK